MKKYLIIIWTFLPLVLLGQNPTKLTESTREEFDLARLREIKLGKSEKIVKTDKLILIKPKKGDTVKFEDDLSDENYQTNEYVGDLIKDKIALIKTQDYNSEWYVTVDLVSGKQKTFIGFPHVYGNNIICLQGAETDKVQEIEFWKTNDNELVKIKSFNLADKIYPVDLVWKNESEVIIEDSKNKFWKTRVVESK